jgi:3-deoxy-D-manno-octulosonic-acid transferase
MTDTSHALSLRFILYNIILTVSAIAFFPWILFQAIAAPRRRVGLRQRLGHSPFGSGSSVWIHAVSVGEVKAVSPMISLLTDHQDFTGEVFLSTVTVTGQRTAEKECPSASKIFYFPLDLSFAVNRSIDRVKPKVFVTAETELWPNFFRACFIRDIPVIVVNGRISDRSFSRYRALKWFFRPFLVNVKAFLMQSDEDARRILELGADPAVVRVTGNTKYDRSPVGVKLPDSLLSWADGSFVVTAGSTHAGEEMIFLESMYQEELSGVRMAIVPRHPERFDEVAQLLEDRGLSYNRYTEIREGQVLSKQVLLVDAMGILDGIYSISDIAFVGGSLVPVGGHNLLEPAMHGLPVLTGPHVQNFKEIADILLTSGGCRMVTEASSLSFAVRELYSNEDLRNKMGKTAKGVFEGKRGASEANTRKIISVLEMDKNRR